MSLSQVGRALVEKTFSLQCLLLHLGAKIDSIEAGKVSLSLPRSRLVEQQHGFFHGGVISTLADTAAGLSAYSLLKHPNHSVITIEFKINFLRPADGSKLVAMGSVIKDTKSLAVATAQIYTGQGKLCAYMLQTVKKNLDDSSLKHTGLL